MSVNLIGGSIEDVEIDGNLSTGYGNFVVANGNDATGFDDLIVSDNAVHASVGTAVYIGDGVDGVDDHRQPRDRRRLERRVVHLLHGDARSRRRRSTRTVNGNTFVSNVRGVNVQPGAITSHARRDRQHVPRQHDRRAQPQHGDRQRRGQRVVDPDRSADHRRRRADRHAARRPSLPVATIVAPPSRVPPRPRPVSTSTVQLGARQREQVVRDRRPRRPQLVRSWVQASVGEADRRWPAGTVSGAQKVAVASPHGEVQPSP